MTPRETQRTAFITSADALFRQRGFRATGVDEVIAKAGGSKGSFYHHFKTKDELGRAVLDAACDRVVGNFERVLCDSGTPPLERLLRMVDLIEQRERERDFSQGCLFGNFAAEVSGSSEGMRQHLATTFRRWTTAVAATLREAQMRGELPADRDVNSLAHFILSSLEGAILFAKVERRPDALRDYRTHLATLLGLEVPAPEAMV